MKTPSTSLLFVCLGNICRSPLAEGIFLHLANQRGVADRFIVDSCGIGGWHAGEKPDSRMRHVAKQHGIHLPSIARQVDPNTDFETFDLLLAMDRSNRNDLLELGAPRSNIHLMRSFDPACVDLPESQLDVPDPYYGGKDGFEHVYHLLTNACTGLLNQLDT